uniref:Uncharacterized protein n=1 Tax=Fagus sylvatica TaxID=28930 RepID=A0A2N9GDS9_FAGSY
MVNQPDARGCPSCGQLSLSGCSSCLPFVSSSLVILSPGCLDDLSGRSGCLDDLARSFWLFGRLCSFSYLLSAGRSGTSCAFCPVPALGWSFLRFASPATGDLTAVSFLVVRPVFSPRRGLVVVTGRSLLDGLP